MAEVVTVEEVVTATVVVVVAILDVDKRILHASTTPSPRSGVRYALRKGMLLLNAGITSMRIM
jgi:hypothetical protein